MRALGCLDAEDVQGSFFSSNLVSLAAGSAACNPSRGRADGVWEGIVVVNFAWRFGGFCVTITNYSWGPGFPLLRAWLFSFAIWAWDSTGVSAQWERLKQYCCAFDSPEVLAFVWNGLTLQVEVKPEFVEEFLKVSCFKIDSRVMPAERPQMLHNKRLVI